MRKITITKEKIINNLQEIYSQINKIPSIADYGKLGKYNIRTINRKFGTWNTAILETFGKTQYITPQGSINVNCKLCYKIISIHYNQYKRSNNHFCSQSHAASYNNTLKKKI